MFQIVFPGWGYYERTDIYGHKLNILYISASWVRGLEASNLKVTQQNTAFLLAVTIFHESVHYGRNMNGGRTDYPYDHGYAFEKLAFGIYITNDSVGNAVNYTFKLR